MATQKIGKLPRRYGYMLNPYADLRLSKCPKCEKVTHKRKFALFIFVDPLGPIILGKECRYCSRCELIMVHQDELEAELKFQLSNIAPEMIGNDYHVLGTVDKKVWKKALEGEQPPFKEVLKHMADFKKYYDLDYQPAGWYFEGNR